MICCSGSRAQTSRLCADGGWCMQDYSKLESQIQELRATMKELVANRIQQKEH